MEAQPALNNALYVVATPIGNLADITLRALEVLKQVDVIAAEDTRNTRILLKHYAIKTSLISLHAHNERRATETIVKLLSEGKNVALVSDAGTPTVSDPGAILVFRARAQGYPVVPLPGASAVVCALSASGVSASGFLFYGFLPREPSKRRAELQAVGNLPFSLVFYEAPHRIAKTIADMRKVLGPERAVTFCRELTKLHESFHTCRLGEAPDWLAVDENNRRGEFVLIVAAPGERTHPQESDARRVLLTLAQELPPNQAARLAAAITGENRKTLYQWAIAAKVS
jgi:16S rRNA (cytidine1402-2'-O)-methyltransferase